MEEVEKEEVQEEEVQEEEVQEEEVQKEEVQEEEVQEEEVQEEEVQEEEVQEEEVQEEGVQKEEVEKKEVRDLPSPTLLKAVVELTGDCGARCGTCPRPPSWPVGRFCQNARPPDLCVVEGGVACGGSKSLVDNMQFCEEMNSLHDEGIHVVMSPGDESQ
nr:troponin T, fast skeletal muscle-like [Procambarus clarkii]